MLTRDSMFFHKTLDMFYPFGFLGPKRRKLMADSWAKLFWDEILHELPVHLLNKFYNEMKAPRPKSCMPWSAP
jgi:hypothetical protein